MPFGIYFDLDNVHLIENSVNWIVFLDTLDSISKIIGNFLLKNVYSDWTSQNEYLSNLFNNYGYNLIHVPTKKRSNIDAKIIVDVLSDTYNYRELDGFIIITGDSDFLYLIEKLRSMNKFTCIISKKGNISKDLKLSSNFFSTVNEVIMKRIIFLTNLKKSVSNFSTSNLNENPFVLSHVMDKELISKKSKKKRKVKKSISLEDTILCFQYAIKKMVSKNIPLKIGLIDPHMRKLSNFDYYGVKSIDSKNPKFSKFIDFIKYMKIQCIIDFGTAESTSLIIPKFRIDESLSIINSIQSLDNNKWQDIFNLIQKIYETEELLSLKNLKMKISNLGIDQNYSFTLNLVNEIVNFLKYKDLIEIDGENIKVKDESISKLHDLLFRLKD